MKIFIIVLTVVIIAAIIIAKNFPPEFEYDYELCDKLYNIIGLIIRVVAK